MNMKTEFDAIVTEEDAGNFRNKSLEHTEFFDAYQLSARILWTADPRPATIEALAFFLPPFATHGGYEGALHALEKIGGK